MDWIQEHLTETWLGLTVLLGVAEMFSLDLVLAMLATGAAAGMVTSLATDLIVVQFLVAILTSLGMLALVRPSLVAKLQTGPELRLGHTKLIGTQGLVTNPISALSPGEVKLAGEMWRAAPYDETLTIEPGETVEVLDIRGATAYVHPVPRLEA